MQKKRKPTAPVAKQPEPEQTLAPPADSEEVRLDMKGAARQEEMDELTAMVLQRSEVDSEAEADAGSQGSHEAESDEESVGNVSLPSTIVQARKGKSLSDKLNATEPPRKKQKLRDVEVAALRVRTKKFPHLSDTQWRELVDQDGVKLKDWVESSVASNRLRKSKFTPKQHKEALQRWPIRVKACERLPPLPEPSEDSVVEQRKLTQAIGKFREKNPAARSLKPLDKFLNETDSLSAYCLHGLIVEMEVDEIVIQEAHQLIVAKLLKWMARIL